MGILIKNRKCEATAERGARFLPTIGKSLLRDLPLATPELDHDALREILSLCSAIIRDKVYSPPPTRTSQLVFSIPIKEV
jgi:hypothetical protein